MGEANFYYFTCLKRRWNTSEIEKSLETNGKASGENLKYGIRKRESITQRGPGGRRWRLGVPQRIRKCRDAADFRGFHVARPSKDAKRRGRGGTGIVGSLYEDARVHAAIFKIQESRHDCLRSTASTTVQIPQIRAGGVGESRSGKRGGRQIPDSQFRRKIRGRRSPTNPQ